MNPPEMDVSQPDSKAPKAPKAGPDATRAWLAAGLVLALAYVLPLAFSQISAQTRALWFSDEVRYANVFQELWDHGHWWVLHLNGQFYPDKPPVYFWLLAGLKALTRLDGEPLFLLGAAVSGLIQLFSTLVLARSLRRPASHGLAAGLILLGLLFWLGLGRYSRMDLLFAALINLSWAALFAGLMAAPMKKDESKAARMTALGFGLAGLATITKGPFGLILPLAGFAAFACWQGQARRLISRQTLIGLGIGLAVPLAWGLGALVVEGQAFIDNILYKQIYKRAFDAWHHPQPFWYYALALPLIFAPWSLVPLASGFDPGCWRWRRLTDRLVENRRQSREDDQAAGTAFAALTCAAGFLILSAVSIKLAIYLLPLFPPLAILAAGRLLTLDARGLARLAGLLAGFHGLLALAMVAANFYSPWPKPWSVELRGLTPLFLVLAAAAVILEMLRRRGLASAWRLLGVCAACAGLVGLLAGRTLLPSLDPIMSPKTQALAARELASQGYRLLAFNTYSGVYSYYLGERLPESSVAAEAGEFLKAPRSAVIMRRKDWDRRGPEFPEGPKIVHEQFIVDRPFVIVARE